MKNLSLLMEYELMMLGNQSSYNVSKKGDKPEKAEQNALLLLHYVFDDILGWTPEMVRDYLTNDLIDWLGLRRAIRKINFPPELDPAKDLFFVASVLYPKQIHYSKKELTLQVYEKLMTGKLRKYPKNFFSQAEGLTNLKICFAYAVSQKLCAYTTRDIYMFFTNPQKTDKFLKDANLNHVIYKYYEHAIEIFHDSLPESKKSELYYQYGQFIIEANKVKEIKKNGNKSKRERTAAQ